MATKAEIQEELDALKAEHEALKDKVITTARDYAETHGWCDVVEEALADAGLVTVYKAKVTLELTDLMSFADEAQSNHYTGDGTVSENNIRAIIQERLDMSSSDYSQNVRVELVPA